MGRWTLTWFMVLLVSVGAAAEEPETAGPSAESVASPSVDGAGQQPSLSEEELARLPAVETAEDGNAEKGPATLDEVLRELTALRAEVRYLQETFEQSVADLLKRMDEEDARLRAEIRGLRSERGETRGRDEESSLVGSRQRRTSGESGAEPAPRAEGKPPRTPDGRLAYQVISEWGRTPEAARRLGEGVTSLKGMICLVHPASTEEDLADLGRRLRKEFDAYDTINIEVFDDEGAAQQFAERRVGVPEHRVLHISKYPDSRRDLILLFRNDTIKPVLPESE